MKQPYHVHFCIQFDSEEKLSENELAKQAAKYVHRLVVRHEDLPEVQLHAMFAGEVVDDEQALDLQIPVISSEKPN